MENNIEVLDQNTIDKIAAGEVVERPASVAKELIENAIDSGANAITVEIKNGGIDFIRITDNGCGIPADQVRKAFLRHATSKLRSINDLLSISSLGFRGEALSSISAVSKVELITRTQDSITGVRYVIEGGFEKSFEEIGAPYGTTFIMRHLFFNTPARAGFLKSVTTEANAITAFVEQLALSHPEISFKYIVNGRSKIYTSGNSELRDAVYQIYGKDAAKQVIPIDEKTEFMGITGYLGKPENARSSRGFEIYFVNNRYVKSKLIAKAIEDAYQGRLMQHKFPFVVLNLEVDKEKVDVNVHPAKLELRFSNQEEIYNQIYTAIKSVLLKGYSVPQISRVSEDKSPLYKGTYKKSEAAAAAPISKVPQTNALDEKNISSHMTSAPPTNKDRLPIVNDEKNLSSDEEKRQAINKEKPLIKKEIIPEPFEASRLQARPQPHKIETEKQISFFDNKDQNFAPKKNYKVIGQAFDTYFLVESDDILYMIDQHAAHEKVFYENFMKSVNEHKIYSQQLLPATVVTLSLSEADTLRVNIEEFRKFGFELEEFGGNDFKITAVPSDLFGVDVKELFDQILNGLNEPRAGEPRVLSERIALRSCKSAVKANTRFTAEDAKLLINKLFELEDPYHCPHGRPTMISLTHSELDKKFKRT